MDFQEFFKNCGYNFENSNCGNDEFGKPFGCNDIPGGFQNLNPNFFALIGQILGDSMAGKLPSNVQNALGNWLQLVGQTLETYSAQQQYFQSGPGYFYNINNKNVNNSSCSEKSNDSEIIKELKKEIKKLNEKVSILEEKIK